MTVLMVALAGAVGAPARYLVERAVTARLGRWFPWGTLIVNVTGSLAAGIVVGLAIAHGLAPGVQTVVGTGFLGAYTTFSTFAVEAANLGHPSTRPRGAAYALSSTLASVAAAAGGLGLTGAW